MADNELIQEVLSKSTNRRSLLRTLATASAAVTAAATMSGVADAQTTSGPSAVDVLQFALNLEYLEAEFYCLGAFGKTIDKQFGVGITGSGTAGATTTPLTNLIAIGSPVSFSQGVFGSVQAITADEVNHVILLRTALTAAGVTPVAKPAINLDAFYPLGLSIASQAGFLIHARIFEDLGVSAYGGAAQFLAGTPYLTTAARILAVEGEHVGNLREQIARLGISTSAAPIDAADILPPQSANVNAVLNASSYASAGSMVNFFSTNSVIAPNGASLTGNGLTAIRTPGQVLYAAYGVAFASSFPTNTVNGGGFFPAGVNGNLKTASAAATVAALNFA